MAVQSQAAAEATGLQGGMSEMRVRLLGTDSLHRFFIIHPSQPSAPEATSDITAHCLHSSRRQRDAGEQTEAGSNRTQQEEALAMCLWAEVDLEFQPQQPIAGQPPAAQRAPVRGSHTGTARPPAVYSCTPWLQWRLWNLPVQSTNVKLENSSWYTTGYTEEGSIMGL